MGQKNYEFKNSIASVELMGTAELGDNYLWVYQHKQPLSHTTCHVIHC